MNKNNILVIILVIAVGMVAFWYMTNKQDNTSSTLISENSSVQSTDAIYIYGLLKKMDQVRLDDKIFVSPAFQNLKDNTVSFPKQTAGRNNPFAPTGSDNLVISQQSSSSPSISR